jgi:hypothetical protein
MLTCFERARNDRADAVIAALNDRAEHLREHAGVLGFALLDELSPQSVVRRTDVTHELVRDLSNGLRLARELGQVVSVVDGASAEGLARMTDTATIGAD